ncbi:MAG: hypothetical protein O7A98_04645 [Acidobacteria bacterium]|nr:hypothetical protein [Acidobacteriota bacterium]
MTRVGKILVALALVLVVGACDSRLEKTDGGGVILTISDFDGLPIRVAVNSTNLLQIDEITVSNIPKNPNLPTSALMNVEIYSYEITFTRADDGTRLPVAFVRGIFGEAPVNGSFVLENAPIMGFDQFNNPPLSDLLFQNGGIDTETGRPRIALNLRLRFFGRTLSGDEVQTQSAPFTIDFVP